MQVYTGPCIAKERLNDVHKPFSVFLPYRRRISTVFHILLYGPYEPKAAVWSVRLAQHCIPMAFDGAVNHLLKSLGIAVIVQGKSWKCNERLPQALVIPRIARTYTVVTGMFDKELSCSKLQTCVIVASGVVPLHNLPLKPCLQ